MYLLFITVELSATYCHNPLNVTGRKYRRDSCGFLPLQIFFFPQFSHESVMVTPQRSEVFLKYSRVCICFFYLTNARRIMGRERVLLVTMEWFVDFCLSY